MPFSALTSYALEIAAKDAAWPALPVIMADEQSGQIVYCSQLVAETFGYARHQELTGQSVEVLLADAMRHWRMPPRSPRTRVMGCGKQMYGHRKDGTNFPVLVVLTAVDVMGRTIQVAMIVDLTVPLEIQADATAGGAVLARDSQG